MKVVKKVYFECQLVFFILMIVPWVYPVSAAVRLIEDHEIVEIGVIVYNTTDGRYCTLSVPFDASADYYVFGKQCEPFDRRLVDATFVLFLFGFILNIAVSKRRIVEEMVDEETGEVRSILSSKRVYQIRDARDVVGPESTELYIGSCRVF